MSNRKKITYNPLEVDPWSARPHANSTAQRITEDSPMWNPKKMGNKKGYKKKRFGLF